MARENRTILKCTLFDLLPFITMPQTHKLSINLLDLLDLLRQRSVEGARIEYKAGWGVARWLRILARWAWIVRREPQLLGRF
jgi:hypothetical protein